ncbi:MAG: DUF3298 domain-containing protein [Anaerolineae bacterium]|nr:DUF3298 domain-containing protein [Anaerolineae bacterium]MEB2288662.1 DUF3298 domain-containing protein [Anaerolineae bacterium]
MKRTMAIAGMLVLVLVLGSVGLAAAQEDECLQVGGRWDSEREQCLQANTIEITVRYPLELTGHEVIKEAVDAYLDGARAAFLQPMVDYGLFSMTGPLTLDMHYELFDFSPSVIGIKFTAYEYTGGAHGMTTFQTFTFDLDAGRLLTLDDLFAPGTDPLAAIAPLAQASLAASLGDMSDADWIAQGTSPDPANYQDWVLTPDALTFIFEQYQVAAYAAGPQTVSIPLVQIAGLLAPQFQPAP